MNRDIVAFDYLNPPLAYLLFCYSTEIAALTICSVEGQIIERTAGFPTA
jgi:hypothetical protein